MSVLCALFSMTTKTLIIHPNLANDTYVPNAQYFFPIFILRVVVAFYIFGLVLTINIRYLITRVMCESRPTLRIMV